MPFDPLDTLLCAGRHHMYPLISRANDLSWACLHLALELKMKRFSTRTKRTKSVGSKVTGPCCAFCGDHLLVCPLTIWR